MYPSITASIRLSNLLCMLPLQSLASGLGLVVPAVLAKSLTSPHNRSVLFSSTTPSTPPTSYHAQNCPRYCSARVAQLFGPTSAAAPAAQRAFPERTSPSQPDPTMAPSARELHRALSKSGSGTMQTMTMPPKTTTETAQTVEQSLRRCIRSCWGVPAAS